MTTAFRLAPKALSMAMAMQMRSMLRALRSWPEPPAA